MAIIVRNGDSERFNKYKMKQSEFAVLNDKRELYISFTAGDVQRLATYDNVYDMVNDVARDLIDSLTIEVEEAVDYAMDNGDYAKEMGDYARDMGHDAQSVVESATPIINTNLQATYSDKASGLVGNIISITTADVGLVEIISMDFGVEESVVVTTTNGIDSESKTITPSDTFPIYIKSYKGNTTLSNDSDVDMTVNFKSELWSREYLQDLILEDCLYIADEVEITNTVPKDADLLGGQPKSYYDGLIDGVDSKIINKIKLVEVSSPIYTLNVGANYQDIAIPSNLVPNGYKLVNIIPKGESVGSYRSSFIVSAWAYANTGFGVTLYNMHSLPLTCYLVFILTYIKDGD